jgi:hypothetical protein
MSFRLRFKPNNRDLDSKPDTLDNCPGNSNSGQQDQDHDGKGDVCDSDRDGDGIANSADNCVIVSNAGQGNEDGDAFGDVCDPDRDGDGDPNTSDCRADNKKVGHGLPEPPGKNWNCDGKTRKYPRVHNSVKALTRRAGGAVRGFSGFRVRSVRKGMTVILECSGGGCPLDEQRVKIKRSKSKILMGRKFKRFADKGKKLAVGTRVTLKITRRGVKGYPTAPWIGQAIRYTIRRHGREGIRHGCLNHGAEDPVKFKGKCR